MARSRRARVARPVAGRGADRELLDGRPEPVRPQRAARVLLLVPRAARSRPGVVRVSRGVPRGRALRPQDASFSYISSEAESDAFFSDSQYGGLGFRSHLVAADELRLAEVFPGSPAAAAGLERNHRILEIDGRSVAELQCRGRARRRLRSGHARARRAPARGGARRRRQRRDARQGDRHDPHGGGHADLRRGRPPRRLRAVPQLRAALGGGARRRLRAAGERRRHRPRPRPALQRRRARLRGPAPGRPHRRHAHERPAAGALRPQRPAERAGTRRSTSRACPEHFRRRGWS